MPGQIRQVQVIRPTVGLDTDACVRIAAYCRVSTDSEDQANSFLAQVKYYREYADTHANVELVDIYADEGITGTCMDKREDLLRLLKDCSLGRIDRVLVKSVSRFARNSLECLEMIRRLKDYGVSVLFENDNIDTKTMNSEMILYVKSAFAQSEALSGSKRVSTAYRMKMENGEFLTYHAPLGYILKGGNLIVDPKSAEAVKRVFSMYLSGMGCSKIASIYNKERVSGKEHWTTYSIRYILSNEKYVGDSILQKTFTPNVFPLRNRPNKGELDKFYVQNTHEGIVSREVFDRVQSLLQEKSYERGEKQEHFFAKKIYCEECGLAYRHRYQHEKEYWCCSQGKRDGTVCRSPNLSEDAIKDAFIRMYNRFRCFENEILDPALTVLNMLRERLLSGNTEINQIDQEIAQLCDQLNRYEKYRMKKVMDEISYMEQTGRIKARTTELRNRRLKLLSENDDLRLVDDLTDLKETLKEYPVALTSFDEVLFDAIINRITVSIDGTLTFVLKGNLRLREKAEVYRR